MPDLPPEVQARMDAWQKYGSPGPEHERLNALAGRWKARVVSYVAPGTPPMESTGEVEFVRVLGGRFIEQRYRGEMGGAPFNGLGHIGYDRLRKEYQQTWLDSMSTGLLFLTGQGGPASREIEFTGKMTDALTGVEAVTRQVMRIHPERIEMEFYWPDQNGREFKTMEIVYTRA